MFCEGLSIFVQLATFLCSAVMLAGVWTNMALLFLISSTMNLEPLGKHNGQTFRHVVAILCNFSALCCCVASKISFFEALSPSLSFVGPLCVCGSACVCPSVAPLSVLLLVGVRQLRRCVCSSAVPLSVSVCCTVLYVSICSLVERESRRWCRSKCIERVEGHCQLLV